MVWSSDIIAFSIQTANIVCPPLSLCFQLCWLCALTRCLHGVKKYEFQPLQAHKILAKKERASLPASISVSEKRPQLFLLSQMLIFGRSSGPKGCHVLTG